MLLPITLSEPIQSPLSHPPLMARVTAQNLSQIWWGSSSSPALSLPSLQWTTRPSWWGATGPDQSRRSLWARPERRPRAWCHTASTWSSPGSSTTTRLSTWSGSGTWPSRRTGINRTGRVRRVTLFFLCIASISSVKLLRFFVLIRDANSSLIHSAWDDLPYRITMNWWAAISISQ